MLTLSSGTFSVVFGNYNFQESRNAYWNFISCINTLDMKKRQISTVLAGSHRKDTKVNILQLQIDTSAFLLYLHELSY